MTTRVFLVDDHEIVRAGLRELLEATGELTVVGEASTAAEANRRIPAARPTSRSSTSACPTATASRSAGRPGRAIPASAA